MLGGNSFSVGCGLLSRLSKYVVFPIRYAMGVAVVSLGCALLLWALEEAVDTSKLLCGLTWGSVSPPQPPDTSSFLSLGSDPKQEKLGLQATLLSVHYLGPGCLGFVLVLRWGGDKVGGKNRQKECRVIS